MSKDICGKAKGLLHREEFILYAPSELLDQIKRQVTSEFKDIITSFEWYHEEEYTSIYIEIRQIAWDERVDDYTHQLINSILGDQYIVPLLVRSIESVAATDGLFNLTYYGAGEHFRLDYYAPERPRANPFRASIYYYKMIEAVPTIYLDSPSELWGQLFRPIQETFAQQQGSHSFSKKILAPDLRDFLLKHLGFIEHIAKAKGHSLQILSPALITPLPQPSNGSEPSSEGRVTAVTSIPQVMFHDNFVLQPAAAV
jgi:hypothetical protein